MADQFSVETIRLELIMTVLVIMVVFHARRMLRDKRKHGTVNVIKKIVLCGFICELARAFINHIFAIGLLPKIPPYYSTSSIYGIALNTMTSPILATLGLSLALYIFNFERIQYLPAYSIGAILLFYVVSGSTVMYSLYVAVGALLGLSLLFIAAIKIRDNYALGLALFFILDFSELILVALGFAGEPLVMFVQAIVAYGFGVFYASGRFRIFKIKVTKEPSPEEVQTAPVVEVA